MIAKSEKSKLIQLLENLDVSYSIYTDSIYIMQEAKEIGAKSIVCIRGEVDFAFNAKGKLIGTCTNAANSLKIRKKVK